MAARKVFDAHFHIFDLQVRDNYPNQNESHGFPSPDQAKIHRSHLGSEAEEVLQEAGVNEAVFVQCYNDCPEEIDWVLSQFKGKSFVGGIVAGLDPTKIEKLVQVLDAHQKRTQGPKIVGIRHLIGFEHVDYLTRDDVVKGLQMLADRNLTLDLHSYPDTIKHLPQLATRVPKLRMVIDHIAKPYHDKPETFNQWRDEMTAAAKHPNVYCKLSGLINEIPDWSAEKFKLHVDHCLKVFGPKRCFYGSDWPVCNLATPDVKYRDVLQLLEDLLVNCTEEEKNDIFYNNAKQFYNIS